MHRSKVILAYKNLLRAQRVAFANDIPMLSHMRSETRNHFESKREMTEENKIFEAIDEANNATDFILNQIIQIEKRPSSSYVMKIRPEHTTT